MIDRFYFMKTVTTLYGGERVSHSMFLTHTSLFRRDDEAYFKMKNAIMEKSKADLEFLDITEFKKL